MSDSFFKANSEGIGDALMEDVLKGRIRKTELIHACFKHMSEEQIFNMAVKEGFIVPDDEDLKDDKIYYDDLTPQDRIIEKILARHGGS